MSNDQALPFKIRSNESLRPFNTFGFDYPAQFLVEVSDIDHLKQVLKWASAQGLQVTVLGGGSNLLVCSELKGLVVINRIRGIDVIHEYEGGVDVCFGAGEVWHECVEWAVDQGYAGIENLALIPGTAGAAPVQNIGAYGVEVKDVIQYVTIFDQETFELKNIPSAECGFDYRESHFKHKWKGRYIILSVTVSLSLIPSLTLSYGGLNKSLKQDASLRDVFNHICNVRNEKLPSPNLLGNAGSFFKNPIIDTAHHEQLKAQFPDLVSFPVGEQWKLAAGWLNDRAGWKGVKRGGVGVYEKQALVLVNYSDVLADGLLELESEIKASVKDMFGVELEREPVLLGERG